MQERFLKTAVETAINQLTHDFQANRNLFWNERDLHWGLYYNLRQGGVKKELIYAEYPTLKKFGVKNPARGHYDLVVWEDFEPNLQESFYENDWSEVLSEVKLFAAVEIKLWRSHKKSGEFVEWDIQKLVELPNKVQNAYYLNFVKLDFDSPRVLVRTRAHVYYQLLRKDLADQKKHRSDLKILCVPSKKGIQPESDNWLSPLTPPPAPAPRPPAPPG